MNPFKSLILLLCVIIPYTLSARTPDADEMESILDRLERRLMDQENQILSVSEQQAARQKLKKKPSRKIKFKGSSIKAKLKGSDELTALSTSIDELENEIEKLANDVQASKQSVADNSDINNFIAIEAQLVNSKNAAIRTLSVKIDGYDVYKINEALGLWIPSKIMPIYAGPMQPGSHRVDVEARIVGRIKNQPPMNNDVFKVLNQSFAVTVPDGSFKKKWAISLKVPEKAGGVIKASLTQKAL